MDGVFMFFAIVFSVLFHPIRTKRMISEFLFGDAKVTTVRDPFFFDFDPIRDLGFNYKRIELVDHGRLLSQDWRNLSPGARKNIEPHLKEFAGQCHAFNATLPPHSPYRITLEDFA